MKKNWNIRFSLIALFAIISNFAFAGNIVERDGIRYEVFFSSKTASVTSRSDKYTGDVIIPSSILVNDEEFPVNSIGARAFAGCTGLTSVSIPNSITSIEEYAFNGCVSLTSISIPSSITDIESSAFINCNGLEDVNISDLEAWCNISFEDIESNPLNNGCNLFLNGELIVDLIIPNSIDVIRKYCFRKCTFIESVTIPNSVTEIQFLAFDGCSGLTSLTIPDSVSSIQSYAFRDCKYLESVTIGSSVSEVGFGAFENCTRLNAVNISDLTAWCNISFASDASNPIIYAKRLYINGAGTTRLRIPESVSTIKNYAFCGLLSLQQLELPNSVTSIEKWAFADCSYLTELNIPNSVTSIGDFAFRNCGNLTELNIPNSVGSIGIYAFKDCTGLTSITIPESITIIGVGAFEYCSNINEVIVPNLASWCNISFKDVRSNPLSYSNKFIVGGEEIKALVIPDVVTEIKDYSFSSCQFLESVILPKSITRIGSCAFCNCKNLETLSISNSVKEIMDRAFSGCKWLQEIRIPDSVITIGDDAFSYVDCYTLTLGNSLETVGDGAFAYIRVDAIVIPKSVKKIGNYAFGGNDRLENVYIYDLESWCSINFLGKAFTKYNPGTYNLNLVRDGIIEDLVIPETISQIGNYTFSNASIKSITLPNSVNSIGNSSFQDCLNLESIYLPNSITKIGAYSFYGCTNLKQLTIPKSVNYLGNYAFYKACTDDSEIYVEWDNPLDENLDVDSNMFSDSVYENSKFNVPVGTISLYQQSAPWSNFVNIEEYGTITKENEISASNNIEIYADASHIVVVGADNCTVDVFGTNGAAVYSGSADNLPELAAGIYIVRVGSTVKKVAVAQ